MVLATLGMALSAAVGELAANLPWILLLLVTFWAFCYGMSSAISSPASWVGQQCCVFLVVSSAVPGAPSQAALRAAGVLTGGFLQFVCILVLWHFCPPAQTTHSDPVIHTPGWQRRAILENLTFRSIHVSLRTAPGADWHGSPGHCGVGSFPKRILDPHDRADHHETRSGADYARSIARIGGTLVGAALATLLAMTLRPDGIWLSLLIVGSMYLAYAMQNVNYALYVIPLTAYIAFILAVGKTPEYNTAEHRVIATAIAGVVAMLIHSLYVRSELRRIARAFLPTASRP